MQTITVINAKGGCGKSTIAMNFAAKLARDGHATLLIDMDPQAQVTQWLGAGSGLGREGTLLAAMAGQESFAEVIQPTHLQHLSFVPSTENLEDFGRQIINDPDYTTILTQLLAEVQHHFSFIIIDSPNQISPIMENAIYPTDLFITPFESTKAVKSYANFYKLLVQLRPEMDYRTLHVLTNLSRLPGLRKRVLRIMEQDGVPQADTEVRSCGWLAQADEHGGSIFDYRPTAHGAEDISRLTNEALRELQPPLTTTL